MSMLDDLRALAGRVRAGWKGSETLDNEPRPVTTEKGTRPTLENQIERWMSQLWVDPDVRQAILDIREMDRKDGRVKMIHGRVARDTMRGGLVMTQTTENTTLRREWDAYARRLQLGRVEKLKSDARGLVMEGNLPLQFVLDEGYRVVSAVRMPSETLRAEVGRDGRFADAKAAYSQVDLITGKVEATFALWQLHMSRLDPDNFDDLGCMGRPFLDAGRSVWRKLAMTEEDLVIRRRMRAPLRLAHVLEGATQPELDIYQANVERDKSEITTDFYLNRKGSVSAVQGDANLSDIGDVVHLMSTFFAGGPIPAGMLGYTDGMARDILQDLRETYFEQIDELQDMLAYAYDAGFRLHLLLKGIVPGPDEYLVSFAQRRTETPNQTTDRMLKWQALGLPRGMIIEEMGYDALQVKARLEAERKAGDPYPGGPGDVARPGTVPKVSVTPGNAPKGESATAITNGTRLGEFWPEDGA